MQSYIIQYPSTYANYGSLQRPFVVDNNLVRNAPIDAKGGEKDNKGDSNYSQPRWCPSGLSHIQKRILQRMRKQGSIEQHAEVMPAKSAATKQVWSPKQVIP